MRTDSERKFVCLRRPNPARKSRGARLEKRFVMKSKGSALLTLYLVISIVLDLAAAGFCILSLVVFYLDHDYEYIEMIWAVLIIPVFAFLVNLMTLVKGRETKRTNGQRFGLAVILKAFFFNLGFGIIYITPLFIDEYKAAFFFFMVLAVIFGISSLGMYKLGASSKRSVAYPTYDKKKFSGFDGKANLRGAIGELCYINGANPRSVDQMRSLPGYDRIGQYAALPIVYMLKWLIDHDYMTEKFYRRSGINNPEDAKYANPMELFQKQEYVIGIKDIKSEILGFLDSYYVIQDLYRYNCTYAYYIRDYYEQVVSKQSNIVFCREYSSQAQEDMNRKIDEAYLDYIHEYGEEVDTERKLSWRTEGVELALYTVGHVHEDYIDNCMNMIESLDDRDRENLKKEDNIDIIIYEPKDDRCAVVLRTEDLEDYSGVCVTVFDGVVTAVCGIEDYTSPWTMKNMYKADALKSNVEEIAYVPIVPQGLGGGLEPSNMIYLPAYAIGYKNYVDNLLCAYHRMIKGLEVIYKPIYGDKEKMPEFIYVEAKADGREVFEERIDVLWN